MTIWLLVILTYYGDKSIPLLKHIEIRAYSTQEACISAGAPVEKNETTQFWCEQATLR
jgi:hypothetical protein